PVDGLPEVVGGSVGCEVENPEKKGSVVDDVKGFFGLGSKKEGQEPLGEEAEPSESITLEPESTTTTTSASSASTTTATKDSKKSTPETKLE
ncbi:Heat shock protein, partial [Aspergillus sclerotialis]